MGWFNETNDLLRTIIRNQERQMATSQAQFDAILTQLGPALQTLNTSLTSLAASVSAALTAAQAQGVDLSNEAADVNSDLAAIQTAGTEVANIAGGLSSTPETPIAPAPTGSPAVTASEQATAQTQAAQAAKVQSGTASVTAAPHAEPLPPPPFPE